jgi:D-hydroxyproline dehydrogenase subunit gamma
MARAEGAMRAIQLRVDGTSVTVPAGTMVSTAVALAGATRFRRSVSGEPRAPLCGMGICFECRVAINGREHCRSCQVVCESGMEVSTDA